VFLGNIMDEGNIATNEYRRYIGRFHHVFHVSHRVKFVFLPGDNDTGGEYEPSNVRKLEKFQETFKQPDVLHVGLIDMFKVNRLAHTFPKLNENSRQLQGNRTRIIRLIRPCCLRFQHLYIRVWPRSVLRQYSLHMTTNLCTSQLIKMQEKRDWQRCCPQVLGPYGSTG
jgi:hypothetical protein